MVKVTLTWLVVTLLAALASASLPTDVASAVCGILTAAGVDATAACSNLSLLTPSQLQVYAPLLCALAAKKGISPAKLGITCASPVPAPGRLPFAKTRAVQQLLKRKNTRTQVHLRRLRLRRLKSRRLFLLLAQLPSTMPQLCHQYWCQLQRRLVRQSL